MADQATNTSRIAIPVEKRPYGAYFFAFALVLALGTLWAVADEVVVRRPWKEWQRKFNQYEYDLVAARRDSLVSALQADEASADPNQTRAGLQEQLNGLRASL